MNNIWLDLYEEINKFKKLKPWEVLSPDTMIIIEDEITGQCNYCVVCGQEGIHYGLNVYLGEKGLVNYLDLIMADECNYNEAQIFKTTFSQQGFMLSFEDRGDLIKEDYEFIKSLGLSYRGKKQWPILRRWYPGSRPWLFEDDNDAQILTRLIDKLVEVIESIQINTVIVDENNFIISINGEIQCVPAEDILNDKKHRPYETKYQNDLKLHRIKKLKKMNKSLEILQLMLPEETWDDDQNRAIFPMLTVLSDIDSGYVFNPQLEVDYYKSYENLSEHLANLMLNELNYRPNEIIVSEGFVEDSILDFCKKAGIICEVGPTFVGEEFVNTMLGMKSEEHDDLHDEEEISDELDEFIEEYVITIMKSLIEYQLLHPSRIGITGQVLTMAFSTLVLTKEEGPMEWTEAGLSETLNSKILEHLLLEINPNLNAKQEIKQILTDYATLLNRTGKKQQGLVVSSALKSYK